MDIHWKQEWTVPTAVGAISFGVGAAVGYAISQYRSRQARHILETVREVIEREKKEDLQQTLPLDQVETIHLSQEWTTTRVVEEAEESNNEDNEEDEEEDNEGFGDDEEELFDNENKYLGIDVEEGFEVIVLEEDDEVEIADYRAVHRSIFPAATPDWDYSVEVPKRTSDAPYIIHVDEFIAAEAEGYSQTTLMYYQGDDILLDEHDVPIYDHRKVVGEDNLIFGKGSNDPSIVYIRNDRLEAEYEVILDTGYYQVEVLGEELEHSFERKPPLHKFRD